jgi:mono/diheme cytochrome c family protein
VIDRVCRLVLGMIVALVLAGPAIGTPQGRAEEASASSGAADQAHTRAPVPAAYAAAHIPARVWTDPKMIAKGKELYAAKCALCHGERGDGKGPAGVSLPLKPADFTDAGMVAQMAGSYWFRRVSEGGLVEPYRSKGSAMPACKSDLSVADRWAVIAYLHTLSGHAGPHTRSEHPEMGGGHAH